MSDTKQQIRTARLLVQEMGWREFMLLVGSLMAEQSDKVSDTPAPTTPHIPHHTTGRAPGTGTAGFSQSVALRNCSRTIHALDLAFAECGRFEYPPELLEENPEAMTMTPGEMAAEITRLRAGIREHRNCTGHDLCWHHPELWGLLPDRELPVPEVPPWPEFMRRCALYRASLDQSPAVKHISNPSTGPSAGKHAAFHWGGVAGPLHRFKVVHILSSPEVAQDLEYEKYLPDTQAYPHLCEHVEDDLATFVMLEADYSKFWPANEFFEMVETKGFEAVCSLTPAEADQSHV